MIVKLVLHDDEKAFSVWSKEGKRLFWSDKPEDMKLCRELLTVQQAPIPPSTTPTYSIAKKSYFNAKWVKGIVTMTKRATGYNW